MAQRYSVDIIAKVLGNQAVDKLERSLGRVDNRAQKLNSKFAALSKSLRGIGKIAIVGAIVGTGAALLRAGNSAATAAAEVSQLERALQGVAGSDTSDALKAIRSVVDDFNVPLKDATKNFTQLLASTQAAGVGLKDTETVIRALTSANTALGGSTEDLKGILLATTQVFSKGKVTAEELRGQIGERLPGAFSKFAQATGRSTAQLDDALSKGEVSLSDFVKFAEKLLDDYEEDALKIASGPENAGKRLEKALKNLSVSVGTLLAPIGAAFQDTFTAIIEVITDASDALAKFLGIGLDNAIAKTLGELQRVEQLIESGGRGQGGRRGEDNQRLTARRDALLRRLQQLQKEKKLADAAGATTPTATQLAGTDDPTGPKAPPNAGKTLEERLRASQILLANSEALLAVNQSLEGVARIEAQLDEDRLAIKTRYADLLREEGDAQVRANLLLAESNELNAADAKALSAIVDLRKGALGGIAEENKLLEARLAGREEEYRIEKKIADIVAAGGGAVDESEARAQVMKNEGLKKELELRERLNSLAEESFQRVGQAIEDSLVAGIEAAIDGTKRLDESLQEIASNLLKDLGRLFIRAGVSSIAGPGGLGLPGYAEGGIASPNSPALVGERGPEIITPLAPTMVTPFDATREAVAEGLGGGPADEAFSENAAALGAAATMQAQAAAEREAAQTMADSDTHITVDYMQVGGLDVITKDQFAAGMAATEKAARARVFSDLRNKPSMRAGAGL